MTKHYSRESFPFKRLSTVFSLLGCGMAYADDLIALRDRIVARMYDALGESPLPSYEIDGRRFDWNGYMYRLRQMLAQVNEEIASVPAEEETIYLDPMYERVSQWLSEIE
jgi:hypothetical protein